MENENLEKRKKVVVNKKMKIKIPNSKRMQRTNSRKSFLSARESRRKIAKINPLKSHSGD